MNLDLPPTPQLGPGLPQTAPPLQTQGEQVVMATESDQHPLSDVDPLPGETQGVDTVTEVSTNREQTLRDLKRRKDSVTFCSFDFVQLLGL